MMQKHPNREECLLLLKEYGTPAHVVKHCLAVADTALTIGEALCHKGYSLDLELIQGAALIHDIARTEDKHWEVGSRIAAEQGYDQEAEIIKRHMHYSPAQSIEVMTETDLVCLADRIVKEDQYVGLEDRMDYVIKKVIAQGHLEAKKHILEKKKEAQRLIEDIGRTIEMSLDQLMEGNSYGNQ